MNSAFDLTGRVAVITGGNGGIGLGMAEGLARAGASVMIAARDARKSEAALARLQGNAGQSGALEVDVLRKDSIERMLADTAQRYGRVDILITNAGTNIRRPPEQYSLEDWAEVLDVNLRGTFLCAQAAHPYLCRTGGGKIITIGSMTSIFGAAFAAPYSASKGGTVQLTKALATAWAKDNIQVNAVLPGWIDTDLTQRARSEVAGLEERVRARTPQGRWGTPADLAGIAVFLASSASDFITGTAIPVDGGYSAQA
ncbi:MAG TPA: glucose 1-dehydrogenase [Polyangiaceae bacterium]|nr:glucose 1-dehydrogenase [Polyangiaceae bacterium]